MFATYHQWAEAKRQSMCPNDLVECPACEGEGVVYEDCCECGYETETSCTRCDEDHLIEWRNLNAREQCNHFSLRNYYSEICADAQCLAQHTGREVAEVLVNAGFTPASRLIKIGDEYKGYLAIVALPGARNPQLFGGLCP